MFDWSQVFGKRQRKTDGRSIENYKEMANFAENTRYEFEDTYREENCMAFASYIASRVPEAKIIKLDFADFKDDFAHRYKHHFVKFKDRYYDYWNPRGVDDWRDLSWLHGILTKKELKKLTIKNNRIMEE